MNLIFSDGSSRGNPGPGGWGAIVVKEDMVKELGGREDLTTNNRMELTAVISALELNPDLKEVTIYTDSAYVVSGITRWVFGWMKNKWKTSQKEDVLNQDLWERLVNLTSHKIIDWKLIKGHAGNPPNERCDFIATSFAQNKNIVLYNGSKERYGVSIFSNESLIKNSKTKSRKKAYCYISKVDGEIKIHKTWEDCKKRVNGVNAKYKKAVSPEHLEEIMKEFEIDK